MLEQAIDKSKKTTREFDIAANIRKRKTWNRVISVLLFACGIFSILVTIGIIVSLFSEGIAFFLRPEVSLWQYLTGTEWKPLSEPIKTTNFGVRPLIRGTLMIAIISGMISIPLGSGTAIYLSEYAKPKMRRILKPLIEILAGIPTVVYGYFAINFITPLMDRFLENAFGWDVSFFNAFSASVVVGIMIIPTVASISEDAMRAVPNSLRDGAYALGATKFEVVTRVVYPAALSGILSSFILAISRAVGETMAVTVAAGATPRMTLNPLESVQTMTAFIVQVSFGDAPAGSINGQSIFAVGSTLFLMTFVMNIISDVVMKKYREVYE